MAEVLRISDKNLGALALPDFCPRCLWLKLNTRQLPFQIIPGIFSSIDAYTKRVVHAWVFHCSWPVHQLVKERTQMQQDLMASGTTGPNGIASGNPTLDLVRL